jgi:hypothetical protein
MKFAAVSTCSGAALFTLSFEGLRLPHGLRRAGFSPASSLLATWPMECGSLLPPPHASGNESALQLLCILGKEMRPKCLLKNAYYCHSERSEESWLSFNNIEPDESTPKRCFKQGCHSEAQRGILARS